MTRQQSVEAIKQAAKNIAVAGTTAYLFSVAPWARLPVLSSVFKWLIEFILDAAINKTEMAAFFFFIDLRTSAQGRAFIEAAQANREAQVNGTPKQKQQAEQNLINAFRDFVKFSS